jgi:hypothetical protein
VSVVRSVLGLDDFWEYPIPFLSVCLSVGPMVSVYKQSEYGVSLVV